MCQVINNIVITVKGLNFNPRGRFPNPREL